MTEKKKIFKKSNFKLGLATLAAVLTLSAAPRQAVAQEAPKGKIEKFDLTKASEQDKTVYKAMVQLFEVKLKKDYSEKLAAEIMSKSKQFKGEAAGNYIQISVGIVMKEYEKELDAARAKVGLEKPIVTQARTEKVPGGKSTEPEDITPVAVEHKTDSLSNAISGAAVVIPEQAVASQNTGEKGKKDNKTEDKTAAVETNTPPIPKARAKRNLPADSATTVNVTPQGTERVSIKVEGKQTVETTHVEKNLAKGKLKGAEKAAYDKILAKIKIANELKRRNSALDQATAQKVFAAPADKQDEFLSAFTRGILFRDVDDKSFVAYNTEDGIGRIYAPKEDMKEIERMIKKAGGLSAYVEAGQKKKVNKTENTQNNSNAFDFGRKL